MNTQIDSYHDLPEPTVLSTGFYIDPNQFDGDDEASEKAAFDSEVDCFIGFREHARAVAKRLAVMVGHRVHVDLVTESFNGNRDFERAFTVMPWNQ